MIQRFPLSSVPRALAVASGVGLLLLVAACGGEHAPARPESGPPLDVPVGTAQESAAVNEVALAAGLEPWRRATPGTVLMGRVESIARHEGDRVRAGDVLARIASGDVTARRAQAEAAVAAARAMELNARLSRERMERLYERQAASRKNVEDATAGHDAARAQLEAAEEGLRAASVYVDYATVRAPFDGVVTRRNVEQGDMAAPGMPLFVVEDLSKMKVEAQVEERTAAGLTAGTAVEVVVDAVGADPREASIAEVLPTADPRSRTVTVRVILDNADAALRPGMFARLRLPRPASEGAAAVVVPESAVVRHGPLTGVFVVDGGGVARLRWVTLGAARDGAREVLAGLGAGERIVTAPPVELEDGRPVTGSTEASR